jgi:hypothetical protein
MFIDLSMIRDWLRSKERKATRVFTTRESLRSFERSQDGSVALIL